jgi:hypothetical protein
MLPNNLIDSTCSNPHKYPRWWACPFAGISSCLPTPGASVQSNGRDRNQCCRSQQRIAKVTSLVGYCGAWSLCRCRGNPRDKSSALPLKLCPLPCRPQGVKKKSTSRSFSIRWAAGVDVIPTCFAIVKAFDVYSSYSSTHQFSDFTTPLLLP